MTDAPDTAKPTNQVDQSTVGDLSAAPPPPAAEPMEPAPMPPEPIVSNDEPISPPLSGRMSTASTVSDNLVVPAAEPVKPPEPVKNIPPAPVDKTIKKKVSPFAIITGFVLLFITIPLALFAVKNSQDIRSLAVKNPNDIGNPAARRAAGGGNGPLAQDTRAAQATAMAQQSGTSAGSSGSAASSGSNGSAGSTGANGSVSYLNGLGTYSSEGFIAGTGTDTRNVQAHVVNSSGTFTNGYQAGTQYATTPVRTTDTSTGVTTTTSQIIKTGTGGQSSTPANVLKTYYTSTTTVDGNKVDQTMVCDGTTKTNCTVSYVVGGVFASTQYPSLGVVCSIASVCGSGLHCGSTGLGQSSICVFNDPNAAKAPTYPNLGKQCSGRTQELAPVNLDCGPGLQCGSGGTCELLPQTLLPTNGVCPTSYIFEADGLCHYVAQITTPTITPVNISGKVIGTCDVHSTAAQFCLNGNQEQCVKGVLYGQGTCNYSTTCPISDAAPNCNLNGGTANFMRVCTASGVWDCVAISVNGTPVPPGGGGGSNPGGGGGSNPTNPPVVTSPPQCVAIYVYNSAGTILTSTDLAALQPGATITLGFIPPGSSTKVRFQVNSGGWNETTTKVGSEFRWNYTLANISSFNIQAQWFDGTNWN